VIHIMSKGSQKRGENLCFIKDLLEFSLFYEGIEHLKGVKRASLEEENDRTKISQG